MTTEILRLPIGYVGTYRRRRARSLDRTWLRADVPLAIRTVERSDMPEAIRVGSGERNPLSYRHDGEHFHRSLALRAAGRDVPLTIDLLREIAAGRSGDLLSHAGHYPFQPIKTSDLDPPMINLDLFRCTTHEESPDIAERHGDDREEAVARAHSVAEKLRVVDGQVFLRCPEPALVCRSGSSLEADPTPHADAVLLPFTAVDSHFLELNWGHCRLTKRVVSMPELSTMDAAIANLPNLRLHLAQRVKGVVMTNDRKEILTTRDVLDALLLVDDALDGRGDPYAPYDVLERIVERKAGDVADDSWKLRIFLDVARRYGSLRPAVERVREARDDDAALSVPLA